MKGLLSWLLNEAKDKGFLVVVLAVWGAMFLQRYDNCNMELINILKEERTWAITVIDNHNKVQEDHNRAIEANTRTIESLLIFIRQNNSK